MEIMDKGLAVPKWGRSVQLAQKFGISLKKGFIGRPLFVRTIKGDSSKIIGMYVFVNDRSSLVYSMCTFAVSRQSNFIFDCKLKFDRSPRISFSYSKLRIL